MIWQRVNRSSPEKVLCIFYNVAGATITAGYPATLDTGTFDGVRVSQPTTAGLSLLVGLAAKDIVDSSYGLFQVYGYKASGYMTNTTNQAVAAGDILVPTNAAWYLSRSAAGDGKTGFIIAGEAFATATTPAGANKKVFIRCL